VLCSIGWQGRGYSPDFTENMNAIVLARLRADPQTPVIFTVMADSICGPCPSRRGMGCVSDERISRLDSRHASALGIRSGQRMSWAEAQDRATTRLQPRDLGRICTGCQWLDLGICQSSLAKLQSHQHSSDKTDESQCDAPRFDAHARDLRAASGDAKSAP